MRRFRWIAAALWLAALVFAAGLAQAGDKKVKIGYETVVIPWAIVVAGKGLETATGYDITWQRFGGGPQAIAAMREGEVQIASVGSVSIAEAASRGLRFKLVWILESLNDSEALIVHRDSGILAPQDLKSKRIAVPFASTAHYGLQFFLEQVGLMPEDIVLEHLEPEEILERWKRGEIDAAFVWNPVMNEIRRTGRVLITAGHLASWGKSNFDGLIVLDSFARENPDFMCQLVLLAAASAEAYRSNPDAFAAGSGHAKSIAALFGEKPERVVEDLKLFEYPTLEEQASVAWLGGGAASSLEVIARFLKEQEIVERVLDDYATVVTGDYVEAVQAGC